MLLCDHQGSFSRNYELRRHVASAHGAEKPYKCCAADCTKSFSRSDKLTDHIRAVHSRAGALFECPDIACQSVFHLEELAVHLNSAHGGIGNTVNAVVNAGAKKTCPVAGCPMAKKLKFRNFLPHLLTHSHDELVDVTIELQEQSYVLAGPDVAIRVQCPVDDCKTFHVDADTLAEHVSTTHVDQDISRGTKAMLLRLCPSLARNSMFDYLGVTQAATT